jgi:hypothetical protein
VQRQVRRSDYETDANKGLANPSVNIIVVPAIHDLIHHIAESMTLSLLE